MYNIIVKAFSFIIVIVVAYVLKRVGLFGEKDHTVVSKITVNITLPAAIMVGFVSFEQDAVLFILVGMGFFIALAMWGLGAITSKGKSDDVRMHRMMNYPCFNIGTFTLPFVQSFLGGYGVVATCMFDTGNAFIGSGGSYALTNMVLGGKNGNKLTAKDVIKRLSKTVPFVLYVTMFILALLNIKIPSVIIELCQTIAPANGFMAMFMLGLMLDFRISKDMVKEVIFTLVVRYSVCGVLAFVLYNVMPFELIIRQLLVLVMFSPTSALVPVFTHMSGGRADVAAYSSSMSIIVSVVIMTILVAVMGI